MSAEQGTAAWLQERCGFARQHPASKTFKPRSRAERRQARANYRAELVAQRLTGQVQESFTNAAMERGTELEPVCPRRLTLRNSQRRDG